ncbi:unnamed protein product [Rotaria sordida]|uniref:RING-type domain-containing protein n=1 Tax=Rotaria sordida TaxID=392033 RepID=A0A814VPD0_9BILA|nr:unnamed protein product [Rotaria sordida]
MDQINQNNDQSTSVTTSECIDIDIDIDIDIFKHEETMSTTNLCISCMKSYRAIAFVPCAHYVSCLACGHGMKECPICRKTIMGCLRIYE